jgi:hypothetical protein
MILTQVGLSIFIDERGCTMAAPLIKPVYKLSGSGTSTPANSNLYDYILTDLTGQTIELIPGSFVNDANVPATQFLDLNASPSLYYQVFIGGALQESALSTYSTSTITLAFSTVTTLSAPQLIQIAYTGASVSVAGTIQ